MPYDMTNFAIKIDRRALDKYGKLDKETIHKVVVEEVCTGKLTYGAADGALLMKAYKFSPETYNDVVVGPEGWYLPIVQYMDGEGKIVFPYELKQADVRFKK
jgi:branched-chain amino acid transport system substrate-binding protein